MNIDDSKINVQHYIETEDPPVHCHAHPIPPHCYASVVTIAVSTLSPRPIAIQDHALKTSPTNLLGRPYHISKEVQESQHMKRQNMKTPNDAPEDVVCHHFTGMCLNTTKSCCREQARMGGSYENEDFICFLFGVGISQPLSNIRDPVNYAQLAKDMNSTNYLEKLHHEIISLLHEKNAAVEISDSEFECGQYVVMVTLATVLIFMYVFGRFEGPRTRTFQCASRTAHTLAAKSSVRFV
ncbi:unnamed protein product [Euphydryas editha]|uniref:Cysteine rich domain-containing protein n=1 Tax=Euphydryas editha TaxID=104508 RepID=A0AAU9V8T2_EUPED|nr:unnamed protein product [Euphydryas editha]